VRRFSGALLKALEYSIENPDDAGRILRRYHPTQNPDVAAAEMRLMAGYTKPDGFTGPLGAVEESRVATIIDLLVEAKAIPDESLRSEDIVDHDRVPGAR